jgi:predicted signal transduction protein with EAL and GGDEF domain
MMGNSTRTCIANSETAHGARSVDTAQSMGAGHAPMKSRRPVPAHRGPATQTKATNGPADRRAKHTGEQNLTTTTSGNTRLTLSPDLHDAGNAGTVAGRLLTALREPFVHAGQAYRITASMGLAVSSPGSTAQALLREADDAMYAAKDDGKDRVHRARDADVSRTARAARHVLIETELGVALDHDELIMYGQPVLDLETGRIVAVETLLRWAHPHRGVLAPAEFLDVAETSPLMTAIGRRVLLEACRLAAGWPSNTGGKPPGGVCQYLRPATRIWEPPRRRAQRAQVCGVARRPAGP